MSNFKALHRWTLEHGERNCSPTVHAIFADDSQAEDSLLFLGKSRKCVCTTNRAQLERVRHKQSNACARLRCHQTNTRFHPGSPQTKAVAFFSKGATSNYAAHSSASLRVQGSVHTRHPVRGDFGELPQMSAALKRWTEPGMQSILTCKEKY